MIQLDEQQLDVVNSNENRIVVIAGAGSGKTRVLTERVKKLLKEGALPAGLIAITFTNAAADELKERLANVPGSKSCFIGTIHSYANKIMRSSGQRYSLLTDDALIDIYAQFISRYCKSLTPEAFLAAVEERRKHCRKTGIVFEVEDVLQALPTPCVQEFLPIMRSVKSPNIPYTVEDYIKYNNFLTFDELILETAKYLEDNQLSVQNLLVDEFQDVSREEFKFFNSLRADNMFLCGDPRQAIYGFKGADVSILLSLIKSDIYKIYELTNNYRTYENIVKKAESVLQGCKTVVGSPATCVREGCGIFEKIELNKFASTISRIKEKADYSNWAILTRSNKDVAYAQSLCERQNIPSVRFKRQDMSLEELRKVMSSPCVKILTVHTAKGLEFDNVILYGKNFTLHSTNWYDSAEWEEERRVMYVGMTRAKNNLYLVS